MRKKKRKERERERVKETFKEPLNGQYFDKGRGKAEIRRNS